MTQERFDVAVVGAGILGLAHALAAARKGLRVVVLDRDARANGSSIRNFGFITVTGQAEGATWRRAMRARDVWDEIALQAGIDVLHRGTTLIARSALALQVLDEFSKGPMGGQCTLREGAQGLDDEVFQLAGTFGYLESPHELRVEPRTAIPKLADWLERAHGVRIVRNAHVFDVEEGKIASTAGTFRADSIVVCPNNDLLSLFPEIIRKRVTQLSKLQMLRLSDPGWRLPSAVMSDFGLVRYLGYRGCPSLPLLQAELDRNEAETLAHGIHLIVVQSADGSLVVGDSHHYDVTPDPFVPVEVEDLILRHARETLRCGYSRVVERWIGMYPSAEEPCMIEAVSETIRVVIVTSGTGMSTSFGIAEEVIAGLCGA